MPIMMHDATLGTTAVHGNSAGTATYVTWRDTSLTGVWYVDWMVPSVSSSAACTTGRWTMVSHDDFYDYALSLPYDGTILLAQHEAPALAAVAGAGEALRQTMEREARLHEPLGPAQQAQMEARRRRRASVEARAEALLLRHLTPVQQAQYREQEYIEIQVGARLYRIRKGIAGNVDEVEEGRVVRRYCAHAHEDLPTSDHMLSQLLMLTHHEAEFLRIANVS